MRRAARPWKPAANWRFDTPLLRRISMNPCDSCRRPKCKGECHAPDRRDLAEVFKVADAPAKRACFPVLGCKQPAAARNEVITSPDAARRGCKPYRPSTSNPARVHPNHYTRILLGPAARPETDRSKLVLELGRPMPTALCPRLEGRAARAVNVGHDMRTIPLLDTKSRFKRRTLGWRAARSCYPRATLS